MGDIADNIKGLEKCGPVKAYELLKDCSTKEECEKVVIDAFIAKESEFMEKEVGIYKDIFNNNPDIKGLELAALVKAEALKKYNENFQLIYLLRRNPSIKEIKVHQYNFTR